MSDRDPFDGVTRGGGNYWKAENIGDTITGTVISVGTEKDMNDNIVPRILLDTADGEIIVKASQVQLKNKFLDLDPRPKPGDKMRIKFSGTEKAARGDMKVFTVEHKVGESVPADEIF